MNPVPVWICGLLFTKSWRIYLHFRHIRIFLFLMEIFTANVTVISQIRNISPGNAPLYAGKTGAGVFVGETAEGAFVSRKLDIFSNGYTTPCLRVGFFKKSSNLRQDDFFSFLSADSSSSFVISVSSFAFCTVFISLI